MQTCFKHQISTDLQQIIELKNHHDIDYILSDGDVYFVAKNIEQSTMTFIVAHPIKTAIYVHCYDNISLTIRFIILFPDQAEIKIKNFLCGDNSHVTILGMSALTDLQNVSIKSKQIHCGKNSSSKLVFQGLLTGKARVLYEGTIRIEEQASGTYAVQHNKNILLSDTSTAISIPNIEVLNHDVQCYHGTAVGKFDTHQIQYMQSRGLDDVMIQQLLIQALFQEPLQGYKNRELILQSVYKKI